MNMSSNIVLMIRLLPENMNEYDIISVGCGKMERIQNNNPFLALLKEQNLTKIKIDKELIPIFKIVISMMSDYFVANDLINVKDWNSFFEKNSF